METPIESSQLGEFFSTLDIEFLLQRTHAVPIRVKTAPTVPLLTENSTVYVPPSKLMKKI